MLKRREGCCLLVMEALVESRAEVGEVGEGFIEVERGEGVGLVEESIA